MRFCVIKIIFLINTLLFYSIATQANDYDFSFDLKKNKKPQKVEANHSNALPSTTSWRLGMQTSLLPDFLQGSGELVYGNHGKRANSGLADWGKYLLTLGVSGKRGVIGYGFNYYSVGQQYKGNFDSKYSKKKGKTGYDSWLSLNIKKLKIKATYLESWTNTSSSNTSNTHSFDNWYEIETSYPLTSSPLTEIAISYGLGERRKFIAPNYIQTYQGSLNLFKTKFRFVDDYLNFSTEIKQFSSQSDIDEHDAYQQKMLYFTSTLFPHQLLSIVSSYRYSIDLHSHDYSNKLNKMESSLGLVYKSVSVPANLRLTSGYKNYQSNNGLTHRDVLNIGAQLDWKSVGSFSGLKTDWTVNFKYKDTVDHTNPAVSSSGFSLNLLWQWPIF
ncbi:MAG: hypothetical protein KAH20_02225 [Methylococcales bacterium]|nr:hypothetical protein [Methylococcales bacterium]